ncbi:MAG: hypothetical protein J3K34DRAFT_439949 [Monoraphidium minutum]|nr:MAG: hypothetical protein J3K34DRAFT_439949 [Monoraphidium minutum]
MLFRRSLVFFMSLAAVRPFACGVGAQPTGGGSQVHLGRSQGTRPPDSGASARRMPPEAPLHHERETPPRPLTSIHRRTHGGSASP